jgi:hypothetical protein
MHHVYVCTISPLSSGHKKKIAFFAVGESKAVNDKAVIQGMLAYALIRSSSQRPILTRVTSTAGVIPYRRISHRQATATDV